VFYVAKWRFIAGSEGSNPFGTFYAAFDHLTGCAWTVFVIHALLPICADECLYTLSMVWMPVIAGWLVDCFGSVWQVRSVGEVPNVFVWPYPLICGVLPPFPWWVVLHCNLTGLDGFIVACLLTCVIGLFAAIPLFC
jgi:hypothetical protein